MQNLLMPKAQSIIPIERIISSIYLIRGQKVMLDSDLPQLYGVTTSRLNEQVKRGWTGQTVENFALAAVYGPRKVGIGPDGLVPANPVTEVVGVRIPSYASLSLTYRLGRSSAP